MVCTCILPKIMKDVSEKFEDTKWLIRYHKSKYRQYNGQKKKDRKTNNRLQNTTQRRLSNVNPTKHYTKKIEQHKPHKTLHKED